MKFERIVKRAGWDELEGFTAVEQMQKCGITDEIVQTEILHPDDGCSTRRIQYCEWSKEDNVW